MAETHEPVAVLGIGAMGHGMAVSALRAGIPVIVWNRTMEATRELAELGAQVADTAAAAARRATPMPSSRSPGTRGCLLPWPQARSGPR
jgi:3-hydroxyacyl-CoA dehydrogenase